ncbi:AraC family transcriptional regulator [Rhodoblastus sp.]|jgi:AraC-like DNA-binding protein|uniref:AraC-like transcriptional regulator QhpR n=1 Tax=Rhodoblastus sp. TaxID=1962975 RepID=UPI0025FB547C|nr:AraC family transcriptional regulator [Rhodoblastus sp.]
MSRSSFFDPSPQEAALGRKILAGAATGIGSFIAAQGGEPEKIFEITGLDSSAINDTRASLDLATYVTMLENAARETGQDNFGLLYGRGYRPEMLGLIGEIILAAPTLGSALEHLALWFPWHQQATETRFVPWGDRWLLSYRILDGSVIDRRQDAELTMGMFVNILRTCLGARWTPDIVLFEHPRPAYWKQHETIFDAEIHWSQQQNAIIFKNAKLAASMPQADRTALALRTQELLRLTGSIGAPRFINRVKGEIRQLLATNRIGVEDLSEAIGMHRWTLQRRLAEEGTSFSALLEETRRGLARSYIAQRQLPLTEIAYMLGYSENSAFTRAFNKWYGASPRRVRLHLVGSSGHAPQMTFVAS